MSEHKPEIYQESPPDPPKKWQYKHMIDVGGRRLLAKAVDSKTGDNICDLYWIGKDGDMVLCHSVNVAIEKAGYQLQGLLCDKQGHIEISAF